MLAVQFQPVGFLPAPQILEVVFETMAGMHLIFSNGAEVERIESRFKQIEDSGQELILTIKFEYCIQ